MGTRSTVKFYNGKPSETNNAFVNVYHQYDGYYEGVGQELADFLKSKTLINGISDQTMETHANGIGCLSAQYIAKIKDSIGGVYLHAIDEEQGYDYQVWDDGLKIIMKIDDFEGSPEDFEEFVKKQEEE